MNYREMLDEFEFLDRRLAHLEHENRYLRERVAKLEANQWMTRPNTVPVPAWPNTGTPAPWPNTVWCSTETSNPQDAFK